MSLRSRPTIDNCPLCNTSVKVTNINNGDIRDVACMYCGDYIIEDDVISVIFPKMLSADNFAVKKIAAIAYEARLAGKPLAIITQGSSNNRWRDYTAIEIDKMYACFPTDISELIDRSLINLRRMTRMLGHPLEPIQINSPSDISCIFALTPSQLTTTLTMLTESQLINAVNISPTVITEGGKQSRFSQPTSISFLSKGCERLQVLEQKPPGDMLQAFVAMRFHRSTVEIFEQGIKPAIEQAHLPLTVKCMRIDQKEHNNKICDEIIAEIRRSKYLVADCSGNRQGVYYEAGFAQGLNIPVIWTVSTHSLRRLHFDTRQYNHIVYKSPENLKEQLLARIQATISSDYIKED